MRQRTNVLKAIILLLLLIAGIWLTASVFLALTRKEFLAAGFLLLLVLLCGLYCAKIFYDFRYLNIMVKVRNEIYHSLESLKIGGKYAKALADNVVSGKVNISAWDEIPVALRKKIERSLTKLKRYVKP